MNAGTGNEETELNLGFITAKKIVLIILY